MDNISNHDNQISQEKIDKNVNETLQKEERFASGIDKACIGLAMVSVSVAMWIIMSSSNQLVWGMMGLLTIFGCICCMVLAYSTLIVNLLLGRQIFMSLISIVILHIPVFSAFRWEGMIVPLIAIVLFGIMFGIGKFLQVKIMPPDWRVQSMYLLLLGVFVVVFGLLWAWIGRYAGIFSIISLGIAGFGVFLTWLGWNKR